MAMIFFDCFITVILVENNYLNYSCQ